MKQQPSVTQAHAARLLGVSRQRVAALLQEGKLLPVVNAAGQARRVSLNSIDRRLRQLHNAQ